MKPCSKNRKLIAWLAMDALDDLRAQSLRSHLESCPGCRDYLNEISQLKTKLAAVEVTSDLPDSASFHPRLIRAIRAEQSSSQPMVQHLVTLLLNWRVALPAIAAALVLVLFVAARRPQFEPNTAPAPVTSASVNPSTKRDLDPTLSNYQIVANRSLDTLDELISRQANKNAVPAPIYTASAFARSNFE